MYIWKKYDEYGDQLNECGKVHKNDPKHRGKKTLCGLTITKAFANYGTRRPHAVDECRKCFSGKNK